MSFTDPVAVLRRVLADGLPVEVSTRVPDPRPVEFVQVRRVGGAAEMPVRESVRVDVWAWAATEPRAQWLASEARRLVWDLQGRTVDGMTCYRVGEFLGPRMFDDPETGTPRSWATYEVVVRADPIVPAVGTP